MQKNVKDRFTALPLDVKFSVLQQLDCFATLQAMELAYQGDVDEAVRRFKRGAYSAIARTEFAPVEDALMALRILDAAATPAAAAAAANTDKETVPYLVSQLDSEVDTGAGLLDGDETLDKLHSLNTAATGIAELFCVNKNVTLSPPELYRFKRGVFRCATLFELYKESKDIISGTSSSTPQAEDEDDEQRDDAEEEDEIDKLELIKKNKNRPRNTFLAKFSHQEVLEMDCVREFMMQLAESVARLIEEDDDGGDDADGNNELDEETQGAFGMGGGRTCRKGEIVSAMGKLGFGTIILNVGGAGLGLSQNSCTCATAETSRNESNDHNDDEHDDDDDTTTTNDNFNTTATPTPCTLQTPHLEDSLLLLGPIALFRLYNVSQTENPSLVKAIIHSLVPVPDRKRDIFWDEVMPFWRSLRAVYDDAKGGDATSVHVEMNMPKGCATIMDVMGVRRYEYAVMDEGRLFY